MGVYKPPRDTTDACVVGMLLLAAGNTSPA